MWLIEVLVPRLTLPPCETFLRSWVSHPPRFHMAMCTESVTVKWHISHYSNLHDVFAKLVPTISFCGPWNMSIMWQAIKTNEINLYRSLGVTAHWNHIGYMPAGQRVHHIAQPHKTCIQQCTSRTVITCSAGGFVCSFVCLWAALFVHSRSLKLWEGAQVFASFSKIIISHGTHNAYNSSALFM